MVARFSQLKQMVESTFSFYFYCASVGIIFHQKKDNETEHCTFKLKEMTDKICFRSDSCYFFSIRFLVFLISHNIFNKK